MGYERRYKFSQTVSQGAPLADLQITHRAPSLGLPADPAKDGKVNFQLLGKERWYVVYAQPNRENIAEVQLNWQGFRAFVPRLEKTLRHARTLRVMKSPVFPRYLFVILDLERDRWRSINGTSGVTSLVMAEGRPLPLPMGLVEYFIRSSDDDGLLRAENDLRPGQPIRLRAGPFADAFGVLSRLNGSARVDVLIKFMNGDVRLNVLREWVEPRDEGVDSVGVAFDNIT